MLTNKLTYDMIQHIKLYNDIISNEKVILDDWRQIIPEHAVIDITFYNLRIKKGKC